MAVQEAGAMAVGILRAPGPKSESVTGGCVLRSARSRCHSDVTEKTKHGSCRILLMGIVGFHDSDRFIGSG